MGVVNSARLLHVGEAPTPCVTSNAECRMIVLDYGVPCRAESLAWQSPWWGRSANENRRTVPSRVR